MASSIVSNCETRCSKGSIVTFGFDKLARMGNGRFVAFEMQTDLDLRNAEFRMGQIHGHLPRQRNICHAPVRTTQVSQGHFKGKANQLKAKTAGGTV